MTTTARGTILIVLATIIATLLAVQVFGKTSIVTNTKPSTPSVISPEVSPSPYSPDSCITYDGDYTNDDC